jgi:hypothetical protein
MPQLKTERDEALHIIWFDTTNRAVGAYNYLLRQERSYDTIRRATRKLRGWHKAPQAAGRL